jgi:hypothetical protein
VQAAESIEKSRKTIHYKKKTVYEMKNHYVKEYLEPINTK